jgi:transposase
VLGVADTGAPVGRIASILMVSVSYVSKVLSRRRLTGETEARPQRCHVAPKLAAFHDLIRERIVSFPATTLDELRRWLEMEHGVLASRSLLSQTVNDLGLTFKKDHPRRRTGPCRRRARSRGLARGATDARSAAADFH